MAEFVTWTYKVSCFSSLIYAAVMCLQKQAIAHVIGKLVTNICSSKIVKRPLSIIHTVLN